MVDEVLCENIACARLFDLEDLNCCALGFSSNSPHAIADNRLLEKIKELACKVDADIAVPLVCPLLLDLGRNLLRTQFFDVQQFSIS